MLDPYTGLKLGSNGGTEQMYDRVRPILSDDIQLTCSRYDSHDISKHLVLWMHDMAQDPAAAKIFMLRDEALETCKYVVFVSHSQYYDYKSMYPSVFAKYQHKFRVIENFTDNNIDGNLIDRKLVRIGSKDRPRLQFVYHTTPHRGLVLIPALWTTIKKRYEDAELHIHSSYGVYGNPEQDKMFENTFQELKSLPDVHIYETLPPVDMRNILTEYDYFLFPSIWKETSCLSLIECKYAHVYPITTTLGAIPETLDGFGTMFRDTDSMKRNILHVIDDVETMDPKMRTDMFLNHFHLQYQKKRISETKWSLLNDDIKNGA